MLVHSMQVHNFEEAGTIGRYLQSTNFFSNAVVAHAQRDELLSGEKGKGSIRGMLAADRGRGGVKEEEEEE